MNPTVVFQTDFGPGGGGVLAGVVKSFDPSTPCFDFTHSIEPLNVRQAAYEISTIVPYWPSGTIFVSVVDPGVGTSRVSCVARLKNGSYVVSPDNGIFTLILDQIAEVRQIDETVNRMPGSENVHIFHGRDVYSYTAGKLAAGIISYEGVGPSYPVSQIKIVPLTNVEPVVREGFAQGGIYNFDVPYGCARINIPNKDFQEVGGFRYGDIVQVKITDGERVIIDEPATYERTFDLAPRHKPFLCGDIQPGDGQKMRFTINDCNFIREYAPELDGNIAGAVDYVFTITRVQ